MSGWFIVGGAGFIGSHFTDALLAGTDSSRVTLYDNFSSGREWHYEHHRGDSRLQVIRADVADSETLRDAMAGHDTVIHLASNPDIARAVTDPDIDFRLGTLLTRQVVEAMRVTGVRPDPLCFGQWRLRRSGRRAKPPRTTGRCCPSPPMAPASCPARR